MVIQAGDQTVVAASLTTTVTIRNPCYKGTESVNYISSFYDLEVIEIGVGESKQVEFTDAGDSIGTELNDLYFCGTRNFKVMSTTEGEESQEDSWISFQKNENDKYTMSVSPDSEDLIGDHTFNLLIQSEEHPRYIGKKQMQIDVKVFEIKKCTMSR